MPPTPHDVLTVSRLTRAVRTLLEGHFGAVWVEGEISNLARPTSGHLYFSLKDDATQVRCAMFRARNALLGFGPANGQQVMVSARVSLYEPRGEFQLIVEHMEPAGEGLLRLKLEALRRKLAEAGLFAAERKRSLPSWPRAIGVVTSSTGAALRDVLHVLARRNPALPVIVYPSPVQGTAAIQSLVDAIATANRRAECDVLLLVRGGGSLEDLWAFNDEAVVRAVHGSSIPIVTGVGHETDFTLADLAADVRAPTPSAAAALCAQDATDVLRHVGQHERRLAHALRVRLATLNARHRAATQRLIHPGRRIEQHHQRLDELLRRLPQAMRLGLHLQRVRLGSRVAELLKHNPAPRVTTCRVLLTGLERRLPAAMRVTLDRRQHRFMLLAQTLHAVSPLATLARGYAIVSDGAGRIVRDAATMDPGARVTARLASGALGCVVEKIVQDEQPTRPGATID